ncbi:hypothetical protein Tco_0658644 [Tanacetum coccineum]
MVNAMFLSPGLSHVMWGKVIISATYLLDKIPCKENKIVLMNYGRKEDYLITSRIDDKVVQDQRQRDDYDLQDERQDQPKEEEVEPRRTEKSFGPDLFLLCSIETKFESARNQLIPEPFVLFHSRAISFLSVGLCHPLEQASLSGPAVQQLWTLYPGKQTANLF